MSETIKLDKYVERSSDKVWAALTEPDLIVKWWAPGNIKPEVGHKFDLDMGPQFGKQKCEVLAVEIGKMISYSFAPGILNSVITWKIQSEGNGTKILLEHSGFDLESQFGKMAFQGMSAGWPMVLAKIESAI